MMRHGPTLPYLQGLWLNLHPCILWPAWYGIKKACRCYTYCATLYNGYIILQSSTLRASTVRWIPTSITIQELYYVSIVLSKTILNCPTVPVLDYIGYISWQLKPFGGTPRWDIQTYLQRIRGHDYTHLLRKEESHCPMGQGISTLWLTTGRNTCHYEHAFKAFWALNTPIQGQLLRLETLSRLATHDLSLN